MKKLILIAGITILLSACLSIGDFERLKYSERDFTEHKKPIIIKRCFKQYLTNEAFIQYVLYFYSPKEKEKKVTKKRKRNNNNYYNNKALIINNNIIYNNKYKIIFKYSCRPKIGFHGRHITEAIIWRLE